MKVYEKILLKCTNFENLVNNRDTDFAIIASQLSKYFMYGIDVEFDADLNKFRHIKLYQLRHIHIAISFWNVVSAQSFCCTLYTRFIST